MNTKYFLGAFISVPLLPIIYYQGKKVRANIPPLPEAMGTEGLVNQGFNKVVRLVTIGESTIAGVGVPTHAEGFTGTLAQELSTKLKVNISWKVYAKSGFTAKRVVRDILPALQEKNVDILVIGMGGNDAFTLNTPSKWRAHIQEMIDQLRGKYKDTPIFFTNMPPIKEFPAFTPLIKFVLGNLVEILGEELADLLKGQDNIYYKSDVITIDEWAERLNLKKKYSDFFSDGIHPSKLTYQVWAREIARFIKEQKEMGE